MHRKAIKLIPESHEIRIEWLYNHAQLLDSRFEKTSNLSDLSEVILVEQKRVNLTPKGHEAMPARLYNLGISLQLSFERTGDLTDLAEAISAQQKAVNLTPEGHADMPSRLNNLGISFQSHFERTGDIADLAEAISAKQKAVNLTPEGHADMPMYLNNLGNSFESRFDRTGDLTDLAEAISAKQKAVNLTPEGHTDMPIWLNNLGSSFESRFERTGDIADLVEAISAQQKAVNLTPECHADMPMWLSNLGNSFESCFGRTGNITDLAEAISAQQKAVNLTPEGHAGMPKWLNNLGISFESRFGRTGDIADLAEAISAQQKAVSLTPEGHADMPMYLNNLGISFESRFERTGDIADLAEAISAKQKAVNLTPEGHADMPTRLYTLGNAFESHFAHTKDLSDIHMAISNYHQAATQVIGPPSICLQAALSWASLSEKFHTSDVLDAYQTAISLISHVAGLEQTIQTRFNNLIKWSNLSISAAAIALSYKEVEKALEWLEQGRCLIWNQISNLHNPLDDLKAQDPALANYFLELSDALHHSGLRTKLNKIDIEITMKEKMSLQDEALAHIKISQDWHQALAKIRQIPNFKNFLQPPQVSDLLSYLPTAGPVIIINVHKTHSDALALISGIGTPYHIPLENFSYQQAYDLQQNMHFYLSSHGVRLQDSESKTRGMQYEKNTGIIYEILGQLWTNLVKPILDQLKFLCPLLKFSRIWWCATGPLTFLPIHAAGIYSPGSSISEDCLSSFAVSSYTPSVGALIERTRNIHKTNCLSSKILLVNPNTPGLQSIPGTKKEVEAISKLSKGKISVLCLQKDDASLNQVKQKMKSYNWIHFACHATQTVKNPLQSGLHLHNGKLELLEIIKTKIDTANFAFLSACQTATGDEELMEEAVHLAAGMLAAGYQGVVATMWSIMDQYGSEIAQDFYDILLNDETHSRKNRLDSSEAAYALHEAIQHFQKRHGISEKVLCASVPYVHFGL
ncbi:hypothetical protein GALMADRAFT_61169 [Galerina marginata CBS 339.88]|uniref:CHAT domain-containing protein n=1 Tax=Galerina marginata (strain CBS 339.88) TaxID=685588 RepID=A0A067TD41_GALM3|nr:hypothetical protein GALMADRAFT_61169 [Galerina marginata CBS 339.88]